MKNIKLLRLLGICAGGFFLIVAFFFYFAPFIGVGNGGLQVLWSGTTLAFGDGAVAGITTAWVFSLILLLAAVAEIVFLVLGMTGKFKLALLGNKNFRLCSAFCIFALALTVTILVFCVRPLSGATNEAVSIRHGAVLTALLTLFGGCGLACGAYLPVK